MVMDSSTVRAIKAIIDQCVDPLRTRVRGAIRRAVLLSLDNSGGLLRGQLELTKDELTDSVELISHPGISIRPEGAEVIAFAISGNSNNLIGIPWIRGKRLTGNDLAAGEVALHIGNSDQLVRLKNNGDIHLQSGTNGATVEIKASGDVVVTPGASGQIYLGQDGAAKKVALAEDVEANFDTIKTLYNTHVHTGVTPGPGSSAVTPSLIGALPPVGATKVRGV